LNKIKRNLHYARLLEQNGKVEAARAVRACNADPKKCEKILTEQELFDMYKSLSSKEQSSDASSLSFLILGKGAITKGVYQRVALGFLGAGALAYVFYSTLRSGDAEYSEFQRVLHDQGYVVLPEAYEVCIGECHAVGPVQAEEIPWVPMVDGPDMSYTLDPYRSPIYRLNPLKRPETSLECYWLMKREGMYGGVIGGFDGEVNEDLVRRVRERIAELPDVVEEVYKIAEEFVEAHDSGRLNKTILDGFVQRLDVLAGEFGFNLSGEAQEDPSIGTSDLQRL